ncbi:MAG: hypothetical protein ACOY46_14970 [Bacillota bacterium]
MAKRIMALLSVFLLVFFVAGCNEINNDKKGEAEEKDKLTSRLEAPVAGKQNSNDNSKIGQPLNEEDYAVMVDGSLIKLGTWDRDLNLEIMLGKPLSEKTEKLGPGADTFAGTFIKRQVYNGLDLRFMSPKDNGKAFFVERMLVTGSRYVTPRGIKTGDSYKKLLQSYTYVPQDHMASYNRENHIYSFSDVATKYLHFEVKDGIIKSITIMIEHP